MYILLVEDDYLQADWIIENLNTAFPNLHLDRICTEFEFRSRLDSIGARPPDVVVMDIMLRWTDPSEEMVESPPDVKEDGFYRAGLRCKALLAKREETKNVPIILYTVLERADLKTELEKLPTHVEHLSKESDPRPLINKIRELTKPQYR